MSETLRRLVRTILSFHDHRLADDATALIAEWNGPAAYRAEELETLAGLPPTHSDRLQHQSSGARPIAPG